MQLSSIIMLVVQSYLRHMMKMMKSLDPQIARRTAMGVF